MRSNMDRKKSKSVMLMPQPRASYPSCPPACTQSYAVTARKDAVHGTSYGYPIVGLEQASTIPVMLGSTYDLPRKPPQPDEPRLAPLQFYLGDLNRHKPVPGFYDTSEEQARITSAPVGQSLRCLENKRKPKYEEAERKNASDAMQKAKADRIKGYSTLLDECREQMAKEASKATKSEKKLGITPSVYQARSKALAKRVTDAFDELVKTRADYESFSRLAINESAAGPRRVEILKEEVEVLARRERLLQERYAELDRERRDAESRVPALEEKIMGH
ncbi:hypothetical protein HYDPIDRAFT_37670 [Hydnomerulius pinastri MD-312]|nr:hypothetical protein HYDPIDRAFT_37670 [Hydnomerulius pinastri MD-312]